MSPTNDVGEGFIDSGTDDSTRKDWGRAPRLVAGARERDAWLVAGRT